MQIVESSIITELKASGNLPSPTGVALTILELSRDENTHTEDLAEVLKGDPALSGTLLKYANSARSGSRETIASINDALVRLGMGTVRQLCLGFSILSNARSGPCAEFDYQRFWTRALAMAVSCQALTRRIKSVSPDEGFTCGLLGTIGQLALASVYPARYADVLREAQTLTPRGSESDETLQDLETKMLSINHNQAAAGILQDWGLPESYQTAALKFEDTEWDAFPKGNSTEDRGRKLARVMNIAALAADICLETGPGRHPMVLEFMRLCDEFGYHEDAWIEMYDEILAEWEHLGKVLDILTSNVPTMENLVRRARQAGPSDDGRRRHIGDGTPETETDTQVRIEQPVDDEDHTQIGLDILVVSDSELDLRILNKKLKGLGHNVLQAADGREALSKALEANPHLILTDWVMPEMSGLELTRLLRKSDQTSRTYVTIMTAQDGNDELVEAFESGIDDYLIKPINHRILAARLGAAQRLIMLQEQAEHDREKLRSVLAEQSILNRKLKHMALEDQLTKLPNRRAGLDYLSKEWSKSLRTESPLLCMLLDIDHFKKVNDTWGHDIGDVVLESTAAVMQNAMRDSDVVCRFGGEEFLVICPGADVEVAKMLGDRLRKAIEQNQIVSGEYDGKVTVSIGVAVRGKAHTCFNDMVKQADEALYAAKEAGRNKVCIADWS